MNTGVHICTHDEYIEKTVQDSAELRLLAKGDGTEVMIQKIKGNETVFIEPSALSETMEFFYILNGELELYKNNCKSMLKKGDFFYVHHLNETVQFCTLDDVELLYFSTQPLFHYLSNAIKELSELSKKVETKDKYTHGHNKRVKDYSVKIANKLNLSKEVIENILFASLFHDLGKINVPDEILNKPGGLTDEEFDYIKKHPLDGANLVEKTYFKNIKKIIIQHHERLNGSGYPNGIQGDDIVVEARIIAISDTYDAMTTNRQYRKALSPQIAIDELRKLSRTHYDEDIVSTFINILKEEGEI
ncbi:HD-GYP domain-containing protein [Clostridium grantii]|uniref:HD-GYP domain, c-di-GMP phosphodiesterase class II (Or its inactivated variant) n=1 Tax=Clostridium grantii DSM 8605 TaxID=1121316 RepID=A0A1M5VTR7_9CLOT|nr:HD-GYP domain-containing protein [Clostridium grantii]SHH78578.1 HD-GYP domain, c-di-GMP phosphodiesterase class II (or its inactivated variant) [Clostridium grantii DSM 8605]